jgi:hypothetical protein
LDTYLNTNIKDENNELLVAGEEVAASPGSDIEVVRHGQGSSASFEEVHLGEDDFNHEAPADPQYTSNGASGFGDVSGLVDLSVQVSGLGFKVLVCIGFVHIFQQVR